MYLIKINVEAPLRFLINNCKNKIPGTCCALVFFSTYFCGCSFLLTQKLNELLFLFFKRKLIFFPKHNNKIIIHQSVDPKMHIKRIKWRPRRGCSCTVRYCLWHDITNETSSFCKEEDSSTLESEHH